MLVTRPQPVPRPMRTVTPGLIASPLIAAPAASAVSHDIRSENAARLIPSPGGNEQDRSN